MSSPTTTSENLVVLAFKEDAKRLIKEIASIGRLDRDRKIVPRDDQVEIPVKSPVSGLETVAQTSPQFYKRPPGLIDVMGDDLTPEEADLLPRGWAILGSVIIVKIHPSLYPKRGRIGRALLEIYPRCRAVLADLGIEGQLRVPCREVIAGSGFETVHRENGVLFKMDATKVMFSPGNMAERMRMGRLGRGEKVLDMFAGIGYFTLPMAVHSRPEKIVSIELNPVAHAYLRENVRLNKVEETVEPVLGDCAEMAPAGWADRVVMGMVGVTDRYLSTGIEALRPGGVLHYHQTVPAWLYPDKLASDVIDAAKALDKQVVIQNCIRVKKYAPGVVHGVIDARLD